MCTWGAIKLDCATKINRKTKLEQRQTSNIHSFIHSLHLLDVFEIQASLFFSPLLFITRKIINPTNFAFICSTAEQQKAVLSIIPEQVCAELNAKLKRVTNCCALEKWETTVGLTDRVL